MCSFSLLGVCACVRADVRVRLAAGPAVSSVSLIVPWPLLSCQPQLVSDFKKPEEENEASSCEQTGGGQQT